MAKALDSKASHYSASWMGCPVAALFLVASIQPACSQVLNSADARPPVNHADLRIVARARKILNSPSKWNRADNRKCPQEAKTFSLYCALEKATDEVSHNFEHRGAAMQEARFVIEDISPKGKDYGHRLMDWNNDPSTTWAEVQMFFRLLESRISRRLKEEPRPVEAVSGAAPSLQASSQQARSVSSVDLEVLNHARILLGSEQEWDRADGQNCPANAPKVSLFCSFNRAQIEVTGSFSNQDAAIQEARSIIGESAPNRVKYQDRLTDFNNDPDVSFADIQKLFEAIEEHLTERLSKTAGK